MLYDHNSSVLKMFFYADPLSIPLEYERILDEDDFARIRELRHEKMVKELMRKHGLKSTAKKERLLAAAQDEADEVLDKRVISSHKPLKQGLSKKYSASHSLLQAVLDLPLHATV